MSLFSGFHGFREFFTPHINDGSFMEKGWINAKEFVEAGDFLVYKCPTWRWSAGEPNKTRNYLPADKQYLVTKNVPCIQTCTIDDDKFPEREEGEWTIFEQDQKLNKQIPMYIDDEIENNVNYQVRNMAMDDTQALTMKNEYIGSEEDYRENEELNLLQEEFYDTNEDMGVNNDIILTKSYDVYITWDKHYRTPRVWLFGYDKHRNPLTHKQMFEDVSPEHAHKTVTYEYHPHENYMVLSIHPCKHASVMKKLISNWNNHKLNENNNGEKLRVDQYLFLFLKFIGTIIPTVEYDYSFNM
jgi:ubiquitin-like-conjugating enzyme ATG3